MPRNFHAIKYLHNLYYLRIIYINHVLKYNFYIYIYIYIFFVYINQYYQKYKEKLLTKAHERYQNLSEEEKDKRRKKIRDRCTYLSKEKRLKLPEYTKQILFTT